MVSIEYDESKVTKLMKTMDEGFYKMKTEVRPRRLKVNSVIAVSIEKGVCSGVCDI